MAIRRRGGSTKNPPILSHEFVIQNHADIVSCAAMLILLGLMFQITSPLSSTFVAMQYNVTVNNTEDPDAEPTTLYQHGLLDIFSVFFYFLICVVIHAVIQEYVLDKLNRKLHLSKVKHSKFNESGQLLTFYLMSVIWGVHVIVKVKLNCFFLIISWMIYRFFVPIFLCFQEEVSARIRYASFYLAFILGAYILNLGHLALLCLVIHYIAELTFHLARLLYFGEKTEFSDPLFSLWLVLFLIARLSVVTLTVLVVWFGLGKLENSGLDIKAGNFNTPVIRVSILAGVSLFQAWLLWIVLTFQLRRRRENQQAAAPRKKTPMGKSKDKKAKKDEVNKMLKAESVEDEGFSDMPAENGGMRTRSKSKKK
ncbi:translocating chain-associated membrane protein 1-like [Acanthaster planci]|uniref:Translocating chain-associated membrane protein 1-like n=1 Tax=Acanthaster planci TaxID=133434 RepID=A0A8B7XR42_ACAPL|nr:translocating chain-associated membrane protein 1-like [Acanthaster planci]